MMTNTNAVVITATNAIQTVVDSVLPGADLLSSVVRQAATLSNEAIFVAFLLGFNFMLKKMPTVYDELIPFISVAVSTLVYPSLFGWSVRAVLIGFSIGCTAVGMHQVPKQLKDLRRRYQIGDTTIVKKSEVSGTGP